MWCRHSCLVDKGVGHVLTGSYNAIMHERDMGNLDRWGLQTVMEWHELRHDSVIHRSNLKLWKTKGRW